MDALEGLDDVDWSALYHAYGTADGVPGALRALRSPSSDERREALNERLWHSIWHQGSRYPATAAAVPFLIALAADPATPERAEIVYLLKMLSVGYPDEALPHGVNVAAWRADLRERRALSPEERERRLDAWVQEAPDEELRKRRSLRRKKRDPEAELRWAEMDLAAYDAILAGVPALRPLLESLDGELRTRTAGLLGLFPEEADSSIPALNARLQVETDPLALSNVITALGLLGHRPAVEPIRVFLSGDRHVLRLAAATALVGLGDVDETVIGQLTASSIESFRGENTEENHLALVTSGMGESVTLFLRRAEADPSVFDRALERLRTGPPAEAPRMAGAALTFAFGILDLLENSLCTSAPFLSGIPYGDDERKPHEALGPFADLTDRQRDVVQAFAGLPEDVWDDRLFRATLAAWGVPNDPTSLNRYFGTAAP